MKTILLILAFVSISFGAVSDVFLKSLAQEAKASNPNFTGFDAKRGEVIFTSQHLGKKGKMISCSSCHGVNLLQPSKNFFTGKPMDPLSPKANPKAFTDIQNIEKWLRRNFNDVYNREGTALEKGDAVTYILSKDK